MKSKHIIAVEPAIHKDWKIFVLSSILVFIITLIANYIISQNSEISNYIVYVLGDGTFWPSNYFYKTDILPIFSDDGVKYIFSTDQISAILWSIWSLVMIVKEATNKFSAGPNNPLLPSLLLTIIAAIISGIPFSHKVSFIGLSIKNSAPNNSIKIMALQFFFFFLIVLSFKMVMPYLRGLNVSKGRRGE